ncbi:MAG: hypothetical protein H7833_11710 [Magnetococcus sp. DMHC-1]
MKKHSKAQERPGVSGKISRSARANCRFQDNKLSWQLRHMDMDGPFGWRVLQGKNVFWDDIFPKLKNFEAMTWQEIAGDRHHAIQVDQLSSQAQRRLAELNLDDIDEVFSLALGGRERIVGIRERSRFLVLWWDPDHQVCFSHKKHT